MDTRPQSAETTTPTSLPSDVALLRRLRSLFPVFHDARPLAIGIHKEILKRLPDVVPAHLRAAMRRHTLSTQYLNSLANRKHRFDLDGNPAGEVTAEQRGQAKTEVQERLKRASDRKRAEDLARQKQEKLLQLAEKFNRR